MGHLRACACSFIVLLSACGGPRSVEVAPRRVTSEEPALADPPEGRLDPEVRPSRYALSLVIDPSREGFTGVAEIELALPRPTRTVFLHAQSLDVVDVTGSAFGASFAARWRMADEERQIGAVDFERTVGPGNVVLRISYGAAFDATLSGLYRVESDGAAYAFTQMEPLGARRAFPCFDEPSFKAPFDVTLVVPEGDAAIANGPEVRAEPTTGSMRRVHFATTAPLPTYLVAFAVGPFDIVEAPPIAANDVRSEVLPFRGIAPRGQGAQLAHALEHTPAILAELESYFGSRYPFAKLDIIAVPDFAAGAMENAGAVTFRDSLLLVGEDAPVRQQRGFAYVMAHELAHMWFGNLATMTWWDDLWLNEAFATWMETRAIAATFPEFRPEINHMEVAIHAMRADSHRSARQIRQPITSDHDIHNAFDAITYSKGDAVLAMFESWLGEDVFRDGVRRYLSAHADGNATASDLFSALSEAAGRDVRGPFESFLEQPGVPLIAVEPRCAEGRGALALAQRRYVPLGSSTEREATWQVPFCARYAVGGEVHRACTVLEEARGELALEEGCADWVMPNADGLGYYRWSLPESDFDQLRRSGLEHLSVQEIMSYADSVESALDAGAISYVAALEALTPLASRRERALATAPMNLLQFAVMVLFADDEQPRDRARRTAARLYRSAQRRLGWSRRAGEDSETQLMRRDVMRFVALIAEDARARREAARRGRRYLGVGGDAEIHESAVAPDLAPIAVAVAIQDGDEEVFDAAMTHFRSARDPVIRGTLLTGIGMTRHPERARRAMAMSLSDETRLNESFRPFSAQLEDPRTRAAAWAWLSESYDALRARLGPEYAGYLPMAGAHFCSAERAREVRAFFTPRVADTHGGPRNLELAIESIEQCAAVADHARESASQHFAH